MIASSAELRERERSKGAGDHGRDPDALQRRENLASWRNRRRKVAAIILGDAFDRWIDSGGDQEFPACLETAAATLRDACR